MIQRSSWLMASSRNLQHQFKWALVVTLCFLTFAILPSDSVGGRRSNINNSNQGKEMMKLVLGSRPPRCINKCMNCRPCMAVLVIPPHRKNKHQLSFSKSIKTSQEEENYYLLSWKCRCKNKLFPP